MPRPQDATPLSAFEPGELDVLSRGLVAVGYEIKDGMLTMTVSQSRICDWAFVAKVGTPMVGDGIKERLNAWREVHVPSGANPVDALLRVLRRRS